MSLSGTVLRFTGKSTHARMILSKNMQSRTRLFRKSASLPGIGVFLFAGKESVTTEYKMLPNVLTSRKLSRQETISTGQGDVFHFALFI